MTLSAQPIVWGDILGSALTVLLAAVAMRRAWRWFNGRRDDIFRHYLLLLTGSFVVFAVSRSFGHLVKQVLYHTDQVHLWKQIAPYSGAVNTATFITVFALGIYFHRSRKIHLEIERHKEHLEEMVAQRTTELAEKSSFLESIIESLKHPFYVIEPETHRILLANQASGFNPELGATCHALTHNSPSPCADNDHPCPVTEILKTGQPVVVEHLHPDPGGAARTVEVHAYPIFDREGQIDKIIEYSIDITERKQSEEKIRAYAEVQRTLLREVNHRVKNNLAAITSMLYMEEDRLGSTDAPPPPTILNDLINRVKSLATVHSLLSASEWRPLSLNYLCHSIINSALAGMVNQAEVTVDIQPSSIQIGSTVAHNLAIILNELTTNTLKHATQTGGAVAIQVLMARETQGKATRITLTYRDNGPGYPEEIVAGNLEQANTGIELVHGIITTTLAGRVEFANDRGAVTKMIFRKDPTTKNSEASP